LINAARNTGGSIGARVPVERPISGHAAPGRYFTAHGSSLIQAQKQAIQWIGQQVQAQSSFLAYMDTFWVLTLISLVAIAIALALRKSRWGAPSPWAIEADRFGMLVRWESMP
jgi:MFS transporter, DHA2 family, multidrug resistance protein